MGSSKISRLAPDSIIIASATRARSPPESVPARRCTESPREAEAAEVTLNGSAPPVRPEVRDDVVQGLLGRHLRQVLAIVGDPHRVRDPELARVHRTLAA